MRSAKHRVFVAVWVAGWIGLAPLVAAAGEPLLVTAVSGPAAARWTPAQGEARSLQPGQLVSDGRVEVAAEQQVMLYSGAGEAAIIAPGLTTFDVRSEGEDTGPLELALLSGRLVLASPAPVAGKAVRWDIRAEGAEPIVSGAAGPGWTFLMREGERADVAFMAESGQPVTLNMTVGGRDVTVRPGERMIVEAGSARPAPIAPWLSESGLDVPRLEERLGVASAQTVRVPLQDELFNRVVEWDRGAGPGPVRRQLQAQRARVDVRTVPATVSGQVQSTAPQGSVTRGPVVAGANSVPPLSPAAAAVGGVSAVLANNQRAQGILTVTGSHGLGFGGLSRLALSGLTPGGTRVPGPAGLGSGR